jgi:hypothetical protein
MKIIKIQYLTAISLLLIVNSGCRKDQESQKIIDTLPINSTVVVTPAYAAQEFLLLKRDAAQTIVPVINRLGQTINTFPELTGPDGSSRYTFQRVESHYGTANYTIQFRDSNGSVIDPIQTQTSTTTLATVDITASGSNDRYSYSETMTLTLETPGQVDSKKRITGTSSFTGSSYSINFTMPSPGLTWSFDGVSAGIVTASGSGGPSNSALSMTLSLSSSHAASGPIAWEGNEGSIHIESNGSGYVTTPQYLVPFQ